MDRRLPVVLTTLLLLTTIPGCALFVMAGKMFWGDPLIPSRFTTSTGVKLNKIQGRVLVYCSAPEAIKSELASIELDLAEDAAREMQRKGVRIVHSRDVARYLEKSAGLWGSETELAQQFENAEVIIRFELGQFDYLEENSPHLFRGTVNGMLYGYSIHEDDDGNRTARPVFEREFSSVYPNHVPIPVEAMSKRLFQQQLRTRIGQQLAHVFVDYRASEIVN